MQLVVKHLVAWALHEDVFVSMVMCDAYKDNMFGVLNFDFQALCILFRSKKYT
jgi:hypothetical protein